MLNGKKAEGKEKLSLGDRVSLFLSEETFLGFSEKTEETSGYFAAYKELKGISVVFENAHVIIMNKPSGILSQKSAPGDLSLNEWMIGYLLHNGSITEDALATFRPSVCNRLDRNTSGLVIGAKSLLGSQEMNRLIAERKIRKFYRLFVKGTVKEETVLKGYLLKDELKNTVSVSDKEADGSSYIETRYYPVKELSHMTFLEAELITGKTHQIRAHLAKAGHPLLGDYKYGDRSFNNKYQGAYRISSQLLHAYRLEFPVMEPPFADLSRQVIVAAPPLCFEKILNENKGNDDGYLEFQRTSGLRP